MVPFSPVQLPERLRKAPIEVRWARSRVHDKERGPPRNNAPRAMRRDRSSNEPLLADLQPTIIPPNAKGIRIFTTSLPSSLANPNFNDYRTTRSGKSYCYSLSILISRVINAE